jgi:hypothetical protein
MVAGHHWTIEPSIILGSKKSLAQAFRSSADRNGKVVWVQVENSFRREDVGVQRCQGDIG